MKKSPKKDKIETAGDLRKLIKKNKLSWTVNKNLTDEDRLPVYPTGGKELNEDEKSKLNEIKSIEDIKKIPPMNPFLKQRWIESGLLKKEENNNSRTKKPRNK